MLKTDRDPSSFLPVSYDRLPLYSSSDFARVRILLHLTESILVSYSDSDESLADSNSSPLPNPFCDSTKTGLSAAIVGETKDFFQLQNVDNPANFWNTTSSDANVLPICDFRPLLEEKKQTKTSLPRAWTPNSMTTTERSRCHPASSPPRSQSNLSLVYTIPAQDPSMIQSSSSTLDFYPRLSLQWPILACTIPPTYPTSSPIANLRIYKLPQPSQADLGNCAPRKPELLPNPVWPGTGRISPSALVCCCVSLVRTNETSQSTSLQLFTGSVNGRVCQWDLITGELVNQIDSSVICSDLLRCIAVPDVRTDFARNHQCLLTGGTRGMIGLWDMRVSGVCRPQRTFAHSGQTYSTSDLLWLTETQFASTSDTVDRNVCDPNLSVWDTRFGKPISHQLYQERWGCSRLADRSLSGSPRFAVQTHGNGIVEVMGTCIKASRNSSNDLRYRLERRWRYEGHDCQAHPLGLAYSTCSTFLASATFGCDYPVLWFAKRCRSRNPGDLLHGPQPAAHRNPNLTLTDVAWIPHHVTNSNGCQNQPIGIQSNGTVRVFQFRTD